jgi:Transcriptional regulator, AbiEi antitoxin
VTTAAIQRLAADQHGIVTRAQLLNAGVGSKHVDRWVQAGRLIRVHQGIYALGHIPPSPHARTMAAVLACGPGAALSHRSAARLWGLIRYSGPIEITAPTKRTRPGLIVHRHALTDADLAHTLSPAALTRAVNEARLNRHLSLDDLPAKLRRGQTARPTRSTGDQRDRRRLRSRRLLARPRVVRLTWDRLTRQPHREAARFRSLLA